MNPLIKWPGGKSGEINKIEGMFPKHKRYVEPFFGGGAVFFHLRPQNAAINDISESLMQYYSLLKSQDKQLYDLLLCYSNSFANIISVCESNYADILVFDPAKFTDHATFTNPAQKATGLDWCLVNGQIAIDHDQRTGVETGMVLTV